MRRIGSWTVGWLVVVTALAGCWGESGGEASSTPPRVADDAASVEASAGEDGHRETEPRSATAARARELLRPVRATWEEMVERRLVRALVVYNRTHFFLDRGRQRGITADALLELEKHLNATLDVGARKLQVAAIPVERGELLPLLAEGRGDIAVASLTVTPERREVVDFTVPTSKPIDELVVTGPGAPAVASLEGLAGLRVYVGRATSYWTNLEKLSAGFVARGLEPIELEAADGHLETEDVLEMVNAGLVPITVADSYLARFWSDVFTDLEVHDDLKIAEGGHLAWAVRKDATGLKEILDPWIERNRQGTLLGNILAKRYLQSNPWVKNAAAEEDRRRFRELLGHFRRYGEAFSLDPVMVAAQGYQESGLDQSKRSAVGAIGVMQVMPATAADPAVGIPDIHELEPNIEAGTKYLRHLIDTYFDDPGIDERNRILLAFAGYNAGPNRINRLRRMAADEGLDPDRWFKNVELVVAREVGREPVHYVANIYKYYVAYELLLARERERSAS